MRCLSILSAFLAVVTSALPTLTLGQQTVEHRGYSCRPGQYRFKGTVVRGRTFTHRFDGFVFALSPIEYGWSIDIAEGDQHYLANMTGPSHFIPNAIDIEGWHFRNATNSGPNRGDVNAPDETRRFFFSPRWPHCNDAPGLDQDGRGVLDITDIALGNLKAGEKANIERMSFRVVLSVGSSACTSCPMQANP